MNLLPRFIIISFVLLLLTFSSFAQSLRGTIVDEQDAPIPYALIYIKEMTMGTSSNEQGDFEVKLAAGKYTVTFYHLSYEAITQTVDIPLSEPIKIKLKVKSYDLPSALVGSKREDPAYAIMRRAIAMAPIYYQQLSYFKAEVYIKGSLKIDKLSALVKLAGRKQLKQMQIKEGQKYLQENVSEITYKGGKVNQRIISESNTFPPEMDAGKKLQLGIFSINIYSPDNTEYVSPLSAQAFSNYKFQYEGCAKEGDWIVNKIKVIPRNNTIAWKGYLYIADDYWNVHRYELSSESMGSQYTIQQNYSELANNIWAPISSNVNVNINTMGNKGIVTYVSSVRYADFKVNPLKEAQIANINKSAPGKEATETQTPSQALPKSAKSTKLEQQIEQLAAKEELSNRDAFKIARLMRKKEKEDKKLLPDSLKNKPSLNLSDNYRFTTDSQAHDKDSSYWASMRPIPLPLDEVKSYRRIDSIKQVRLMEKTDSSTSKKKASMGSILADAFMGKTFRSKDSTLTVKYGGLLDMEQTGFIGFNLVDGFTLRQSLSLTKRFKDTTRLRMNLQGGYALARKSLLLKTDVQYQYLPEKQAVARLGGTFHSMDFNQQSTSIKADEFDNMVWTLFARQNFMRYFQDASVYAEHSIEPVNGLMTNVRLSYHHRQQLHNNSNYSVFFRSSREFSPNVPLNSYAMEAGNDLLNDRKSTLLSINVSYTPQMQYVMRNRSKYNVRSPYPTLSLMLNQGIPNVLGGASDFTQVELGVRQSLRFGFMQTIHYDVSGGWFPSHKSMHFTELKHFKIKPYFFSFSSYSNGFGLIPMYSLSEQQWYTTINAGYHTPFLLLKYAPLLSKSNMQENISVAYIKSALTSNYTELSYGLSNIFLMGEASVVVGFSDVKYSNVGLRFAFRLN